MLGAGHVAMTLIADVAAGFGALPRRSAAIEVEPESIEPRDELTPAVAQPVPQARALARREVLRLTLLEQADRVEAMLRATRRFASRGDRPELELMSSLRRLDDAGEWGDTPAVAARVRRTLAQDVPARPDDDEAALQQATGVLLDSIGQTISAEATLDGC